MADMAAILAIGASAAAIVSAAASAFSARNSARSASASEKSADASVTALHRAAVKDLVILCHEALVEESRIRSLGIDVASETTTLFNTFGNFGSSRHTLATQALEKDVKRAEDSVAEARKIVGNFGALYA